MQELATVKIKTRSDQWPERDPGQSVERRTGCNRNRWNKSPRAWVEEKAGMESSAVNPRAKTEL